MMQVGRHLGGSAKRPGPALTLQPHPARGIVPLQLQEQIKDSDLCPQMRLQVGLLDRLVDAGRSVIVIEHHQAVMAHADWIIDLGPGAGHDGGRVVFEGTPADLVAGRSTLTGEHLAAYVGG